MRFKGITNELGFLNGGKSLLDDATSEDRMAYVLKLLAFLAIFSMLLSQHLCTILGPRPCMYLYVPP